jgi:hypothetical protein
MSRTYEILVEAAESDLDRLLGELSPETSRQVIRGTELHLEAGSFSERIRDLLGARTHQILFAPEEAAGALAAAVRRDSALRLDGLRELSSAAFSFRAEAYSEPVKDDIRGFLCSALPPGVRLKNFSEREERDPEAKGVELFAPAHELTWQAEGTLEGAPSPVLELQRRAVAHDFCHPGPLELAGREVLEIPGGR